MVFSAGPRSLSTQSGVGYVTALNVGGSQIGQFEVSTYGAAMNAALVQYGLQTYQTPLLRPLERVNDALAPNRPLSS